LGSPPKQGIPQTKKFLGLSPIFGFVCSLSFLLLFISRGRRSTAPSTLHPISPFLFPDPVSPLLLAVSLISLQNPPPPTPPTKHLSISRSGSVPLTTPRPPLKLQRTPFLGFLVRRRGCSSSKVAARVLVVCPGTRFTHWAGVGARTLKCTSCLPLGFPPPYYPRLDLNQVPTLTIRLYPCFSPPTHWSQP